MLIQSHIQNQRLQKVGFTVVPEVVSLTRACVADDDIGQHLSHQGIPAHIRHAVPCIGVHGIHQVEDLHLIPIFAKQLRGIIVHLALRVRYDHGLPSLDGLEQIVADHSTGFHGAGSAKHCGVPIQSGVLGKTHQLAIALTEDVTFCLRRRCQLQDFFHVLITHPACGAIGARLADRKASGVMQLPGELIVEFHIEINCCHGGQKQRHTLQTIPGKCAGDTADGIPVWRSHLRSTPHTTGIHPDLIVGQNLSDQTAQVQHRKTAKNRCNDDCSLTGFFIHITLSHLHSK